MILKERLCNQISCKLATKISQFWTCTASLLKVLPQTLRLAAKTSLLLQELRLLLTRAFFNKAPLGEKISQLLAQFKVEFLNNNPRCQ
jgi:hypothetical protein